MPAFSCRASLYRQFAGLTAADRRGWVQTPVTLDSARTAILVMHAWDPGKPENLPGRERAVEYLGRARLILSEVFPPLLTSVRGARLPVLHLLEPGPAPRRGTVRDSTWHAQQALRRALSYPGEENQDDVDLAFADLRAARQATPAPGEPTLTSCDALTRHCYERGINHLIYIGFALNWCLLMSPGGMIDMKRRGFICSTIPEATTAVERHDTAAEESEKASALWRVAVEFGFVFSRGDFQQALRQLAPPPSR